MAPPHHTTPTKAKIKGACEFLDAKGIPYSHMDVFRFYGASKTVGWQALREPETSDGPHEETRGRKKKLTNEDIAQIERLIESDGFDGSAVPWAALPAAAGLDVNVCAETVRRAIKDRNFRKCMACSKAWVSRQLAERRVEYARKMLEMHPNKEDWRRIRFSDEAHFSRGPQGKVYVARRPWERYCPDCVADHNEPEEKDKKRLHAWAAVGYDFKSELVWYDVPGNVNGKMTLQTYRDTILEPVVGSWLAQGHFFILEEDGDSGYGTSKQNIVRTWKQARGVTSYFNCAQSPDFVPIERAWMAPKEAVKRGPCWEDSEVKELAEDGWAGLQQSAINRWVDEIPQVLKDCIALGGRMTGH